MYRHAALRALPEDAPAFMAAIMGLSRVELIREAELGLITAEYMESPPTESVHCTHRVPVALTVWDVAGDATPDVLVDDFCGNYVLVGESGGFEAVPQRSIIPQNLGAQEYSEVALTKDGERILMRDGDMSVQSLRRTSAGFEYGLQIVPEPLLSPLVMRRAASLRAPTPDAERLLLVQAGGRFVRYEVREGGVGLAGEYFPGEPEAPYTAPFDGFDHWTPVEGSGAVVALGVGAWGNTGDIAPPPRELQRIEWDSEASEQYRTRAIPLDFDVSTFATAEGSDDSELFVGVLGAEAEPPQFALLRLSLAGEAELLAQIDVEFDYRTAPLPQFGPDVAHHKGNGIPFLGFYDPELPSLSFYHYDGYELRVFRAQNQGRSWELSQEKHTLHDERTDLSAPATN